MNIYFSASITGGRKYLLIYKHIVSYLKDKEHRVLTEHIIHDDVLEREKAFTAQEVFERDIQWLSECDAVIAEVTNPSLGVGYEICYALEQKKPTLCIFQKHSLVSKMITGNTSRFLELCDYDNEKVLLQHIDTFLKKIPA